LTRRAAPFDHELSESSAAPETLSATERRLAWALLGCGLLLRLLYIWRFRIDSDEPQHLHVVWAWTRGLLPYRDVFDNHSPLFQALYAPLFHLLGVRPDILLPMRLAELPIFALTIFCVWKIGAALYSPRTALWTAVLAAFYAAFYFDSIEFRPDQLWTLVWMLILLVLVTGPLNPRRMLLAGLLLGLAFSVSMKTSLFLATLAQSLIGALLVRRAAGGMALPLPQLVRCAVAAFVGLPIVPAIVVLYFTLHGAGHDLYQCVIEHNILPGSTAHFVSSGAIRRCLLGLTIAAAGSYLISRLDMPITVRTRISFLFIAGLLYRTTLDAFWPILTAEDYLPFYPAMALTAGPLVLWLAKVVTRNARFPAGAVLAGVELAVILVMVSPFQDQTTDKIGMVADTLKLTTPDDFVMDSKGETIYRNRAFKYVFESMTFHRMQQGLIPNTVVQDLITKHVPLATTRRMPPDAREFIKDNYVPIAYRLYVPGKVLAAFGIRSGTPCDFEVLVKQRYTFITPAGPPAGALDGTPFNGPRELAAGPHTFLPNERTQELVLIWAAAIERGYSPFATIKKDFTTPQD
jgi:hypothetical protein